MVLPLATSGPTSPVSTGRHYRNDRFSCSIPAPATSSRHLYTGHHQGHIQAAPQLRAHPEGRAFVPEPPTGPGFDVAVYPFDASAVVHTCSSSRRTPSPADSETSTATLTTPALDRRSLRWFGISACTAIPEDLPPSLVQHGSCWRSSTSSSLPFRTHVGAEYSAVWVDRGKRGRSLLAVSCLLYRLIATLARLAVRSGRSKDLEIIVLRHQLSVTNP